MSKIIRLCTAVIFCLFVAAAPLSAQSSKSVAAALTPAEAEKWREDLRVLATEMPLRHRNLFHTVKREEFEAAVKNLNERIPTLTRNQVIVEFMRLVGMIQDGHTSIAGLLWDPKIGFRSYPLSLYFFKDGLFVIAADPEHANAVGAKVLKIGNKSAQEAFD